MYNPHIRAVADITESPNASASASQMEENDSVRSSRLASEDIVVVVLGRPEASRSKLKVSRQ
jgi:hypothetical protein